VPTVLTSSCHVSTLYPSQGCPILAPPLAAAPPPTPPSVPPLELVHAWTSALTPSVSQPLDFSEVQWHWGLPTSLVLLALVRTAQHPPYRRPVALCYLGPSRRRQRRRSRLPSDVNSLGELPVLAAPGFCCGSPSGAPHPPRPTLSFLATLGQSWTMSLLTYESPLPFHRRRRHAPALSILVSPSDAAHLPVRSPLSASSSL